MERKTYISPDADITEEQIVEIVKELCTTGLNGVYRRFDIIKPYLLFEAICKYYPPLEARDIIKAAIHDEEDQVAAGVIVRAIIGFEYSED